MKKARDFLLGFLALNLLWLAAALLFRTRVVPNPVEVYAHFDKILASGIFFHIGASLWRVAAGLAVSLLLGIPLGVLMARSQRWGRVFSPLIYFSYPIPKTALLPVAMLLFGLGDGSKILIMVLTTFFPVVVAARDAVACVDPGFYAVAKSAGAGRLAALRHITLPAILPGLFTSLRVNTGTALAILFLVEAYGTRAGVGYYILDSWSRLSYVEMYGGIVVIAVMGAALFLLTDLAADRLCRWKG
ncbi:MAG: ABC transporter permease [Clostridia bacterium]|nr:ABC transporter permease [Clostridia bacterium]